MEIKEVVVHSIESSKYKVQFEQAATKGVIGFKVEANDDDQEKCKAQAADLLQYALKKSSLSMQPVSVPAVTTSKTPLMEWEIPTKYTD